MKGRKKKVLPKENCSLKRGLEVVVISGAHRGKRGKVLKVNRDSHRVFIDGVALQKKHLRKSKDNPEGSIVEREGSMHWSNVMIAERFDERKQKRESNVGITS